jgi:hypothetical protein
VLSGNYAGDIFHLSNDGNGGTDITIMPCFAAGTRIATERGEVAVEELRIGDAVLTAGGAARPIVWIGERLVDCRRHPQPALAWPVRVRAGAFGEGLPVRDLLLSPDHSVFVDGVLIPIRYLVNGATIAQESVSGVHYFHVELDRHGILLAERLPAESYLDTGNRHVFANGAAHMALHPDFAPLGWDDACARLATSGAAVATVRQRLIARVLELGYRIVADAELRVLVGTEAMRASTVRGKLQQFVVPAGTAEMRIVSRTGVPAGLDLASEDCRTLGARIGAIFVDGDIVPLDDAALAAGFHPIEGSGGVRWRWTDGAALLRLPAPLPRPAVLELLVRDTMRHWQHPARRIAAAA